METCWLPRVHSLRVEVVNTVSILSASRIYSKHLLSSDRFLVSMPSPVSMPYTSFGHIYVHRSIVVRIKALPGQEFSNFSGA